MPDNEMRPTEPNEGAQDPGVRGPDSTDAPKAAPKLGPLLDEPDEAKAAKLLLEEWERQDKPMTRRRLQWRVNRKHILGNRFVFLRWEGEEDRSTPMIFVPEGADLIPTPPNRLPALLRKVTAQMTVDPPMPDAEPSTDEDQDRAAAEFSTRVLRAEGSEAAVNDLAVLEAAVERSHSAASGFTFEYVDPAGGGPKPRQILAHPLAIDANEPLIDPMTGLGPQGGEYIERYVTPDGQITDDPSQADIEWLPKVKTVVLDGHSVRMVPETAGGIGDAHGVLICMPVQVGELKLLFPDTVGRYDDTKLQALIKWRPKHYRDMMPDGSGEPKGISETKGGEVTDDCVAFVLTGIYIAHPTYPKGAYVAASGECLLHRETWVAPVEHDGAEREEPLMLPVAQFRQLLSPRGDPYGSTFVEELAAAEEGRSMVMASWYDWADRFARPNVFLPLGSVIQPKQLTDRDGTPILFNPAGKPEYENVPTFPPTLLQLEESLSDQENDIVGLQEEAQGLNSPSVKSGTHAEAIQSASQVALSPVRMAYNAGCERRWRIRLQLMRAFYTQPQLVSYTGEDGQYKRREWTGTDLGSTKDIRVARGTGTGMSPWQKMQLATQQMDLAKQMGDVQRTQELQRAIIGNIAPILALQDDPHLQRIKGQLSTWRDGPPEVTPEQEAQYAMLAREAAMQPPSVDPITGAVIPAAAPPSPIEQAALALFDQRLVDDEPAVALIRHAELARTMASTAFGRQPPEWQQALIAEYERARYAAGVQTMAEQALAAQQQQQMATEEGDKERGAKSAEGEKDRQFKGEQADADRAASTQQAQISAAAKQQSGQNGSR